MEKLTEAAFWAKLSIPMLLSALGGVVRTLQRSNDCSWKSLAVGTLTSFFTGVCVHFLITDMDVSGAVKAGIVGISSFAGGDLLRILSSRVCKVAKGE